MIDRRYQHLAAQNAPGPLDRPTANQRHGTWDTAAAGVARSGQSPPPNLATLAAAQLAAGRKAVPNLATPAGVSHIGCLRK